jgi:glycosyltransferase involved in cell wall biosynthesis
MRIRFYGHLRAGFGLAGGASATARILQACGCDLELVDLPLASHAAIRDLEPPPAAMHDQPVHVDLVHTNPNILASTPELLEAHPLEAPLRIGYWAWELECFPSGWERFFTGYQEIWCPSAFTAQALAQRSPVPVVAVPHLPDWPHLQARAEARRRWRQQAAARPFTFLSLFDYWSTTERKNPAGVIQAFQSAFPRAERGGPSVQLLIKASSAEQFPEQAAALKAISAGDRRIRWLEQLLHQNDLDALYQHADALVSLHRAEGFGLTLAEAMALGIPTIATGYSGNLEFMPPGSALLIPWQRQILKRSAGDYQAGAFWAEPDLQAAAAAMRQLAEDPSAAAALGRRGQQRVRERLSQERLSGIVRQRLGRWLLDLPSPTA